MPARSARPLARLTPKMDPSAVIIGAGHQGLVAAIGLAGAGCDVVVLEASDEPGGAVRTAELTLPGFRHDVCSGFFPLTAASPAFRELELEIPWIDPAVAMAHVFDGGEEIVLHRDVDETARSLESCSRGAGRAWQRLVASLWPHRERLIRAGLAPLPSLAAWTGLLARLRAQAIELAPLALASSAALGRDLFGDERAAAWLAGSGAHADLSPFAAGSGVFALGLNFLGHAVGWPVPRRGAGTLTYALVRRLEDLGGKVRCGAPADAIEVAGGRVCGVRLSDGDPIATSEVIATTSPAVLLELLPQGVLPGRLERRLRGWRYGLGTLKLDYALSAPVPWRSPHARRAGVVQIGGPLGEVAASLEQALQGRLPERPSLVVGQQSLHDDSRAPQGTHTLYVYARVPQHLELDEEAMAAPVERQLERFAPGFGELVMGRSIRSPRRIEAENGSMRGGDLASGSCEPDQQLIFRPAPALCRGRSPLEGLYVAGAWVHPGPGVNGVSGRAAAQAVLADLRVARRLVRRARAWRARAA
jgi:phytoene dehydrogenase-like protein